MEEKSELKTDIIMIMYILSFLGFLTGLTLMFFSIIGLDLGIAWWGYLVISLISFLLGITWLTIGERFNKISKRIHELEEKIKKHRH